MTCLSGPIRRNLSRWMIQTDTQPTPNPEGGRGTGIVKTGDESRLPLLAAVGAVSGLLLLIYCIYCFREHKKGKKEA